MRFSCNYDVLLGKLVSVASVVEDSLSSEDMKNIIFKLDKSNSVKLIGINQLIKFRKELDKDSYTLDLADEDVDSNGVMFMQLKSKELLGFLNSYKSVRKTVVTDVIFESMQRGQIKCTVLEKELPDGAGSLSSEEIEFLVNSEDTKTIASHWVFNNVPVKPNLLGDINLVAPDGELTTIPRENILFHTRNLLPVMQNGTNLFSYMMFDGGNVVAFNAAYTTVMKNEVGEGGVFDAMKLSYRAISFMDKIICNDEFISVAKTDRHIYFKTDSSEAFIVFDNKLAAYQSYVDMFIKDHAIVLDRVYLKDVLKRLSLVNDNIEFSIEGGDQNKVTLRNSKFSQELPILQSKDIDKFNKITFKIMPDVLNKAIIGSDDEFPSDVFVYYCPHANNNVIVFADGSGSWFSVVRVKVY